MATLVAHHARTGLTHSIAQTINDTLRDQNGITSFAVEFNQVEQSLEQIDALVVVAAADGDTLDPEATSLIAANYAEFASIALLIVVTETGGIIPADMRAKLEAFGPRDLVAIDSVSEAEAWANTASARGAK